MTPMSSLKFCIILFSLPTLITIITEAQNTPNYLGDFCINANNFTSGSPYQANLNAVLSFLASNATPTNNINGFHNASAGQALDEVYGLFLCRGDLSADVCQNCVSFATKDIVQRCPIQKVAFIWYDECFLRYADTNIFSAMTQDPGLYLLNTQNVSVDVNFNQLLVTTITEAATQAAAAPSGAKKIAVKQVNYTWQDTLYVLAQCTPDLSSSDCNLCLQAANAILPTISNNKRGGRVLFPSCYFEFEMYPFYNQTAFLAGAPPPNGKGSKRKWVIVGAILSVIVGLLLSISCTFIIWRRKILRKEESENGQVLELLELGRGNLEDDYYNENIQGEVKPQDFHLIRLDTLKEATNQFSDENKLGQGGFGPVYKGKLEDGKEIAVKRLSINSGQGLREFMNEVILIAKLQHRNLVRLVGCCLEKNEKLLIYEYMPNKSLDFFLFDSRMAVQLDWQRRLDVINGIARGLLYLHEDSRLRIIHRDLKASNILLDYEMNPKISDFGMARIFARNESEANTNRIVGTFGYMAPEYAMEGMSSIKSDVFSFGVLMLEIISGKKNSGFHLLEEGESLLTFTWKLWSKGEALDLMEPLLDRSGVAEEILKCIHIGLLCVQEDPADRPTMSSVVVMLASENIKLPMPTQPAFSVGRVVVSIETQSTNATETQSSDQKVCSVNEVTLSNASPR